MSNVVGIDLASAPEHGAKRYNRVGLAALDEGLTLFEAKAGRFLDEDILDFVRLAKATVVAIDSPLSVPAVGSLRDIDRIMLKRGFRPYPPLLPSMVALTARGIALRSILESERIDVIEVYPGAAQDVLGLPRKQSSVERLANGLASLGIRPLAKRDGDILDAVTASFVGRCYLTGMYEALGPSHDVQVINPIPLNG
jgi:predicted nuclease with RNAse H fold